MSDVTFFHHERVDDARRTGLTVGGSRGLERYVPGDEEYDPTLRWFVVVRCPVTTPPETREEAVVWLVNNHETIRSALAAAAERLAAGMDSDWSPWTFDVDTAAGPVRVSVSAQKHYDGHRIGDHLKTLLDRDWPAFVAEYTPALAGA